MAHALRYYKEIQQENGQTIRLEIHRKDSTLPSVEIGRVLQVLRLDIQGGADTIDAPIVKTSLTMTFVDAPDLEAGKKCGDWEEIYTPDSTMWKVVLKADGKTIWGGYVTPDSYQEDLRYRGSVTIIARDNIGHMQDFPFDMEGNADGMVTLEQLVNEAWAKIESPMRLDWWHEEQEAMYLMCEGNDAPSTYMNVSAFEDMNYFDAVEKALYSYGLVMRYTGSNRVTIMSLRDLPYQGKSSAPRAIEPTFIAHAQRELAPAVRRIEESVKYEDVEAVQPQVKPRDFSGVSDHYAYEFGHPSGATLETAPVHNIINTDERNGWANMPGKTLFFNAGLYELSNFDKIQPYADIMHRYMYIAVNNVQNISLDNVERFVSYGRNMLYQDFGFSLNLGILIEWSGALVLRKVTGYTLSGITYAVGCEYEGDIIYYAGDGKWQDSVCEITQEISGNEENNTIDISVLVDRTKSYKTATFILYIRRISYTRQGDLASGRGLYAAVQSLSITHNNALLSDNTVNTVYNNDNNVIISREPEIAPALNSVILPSVIKNGIFVKSGNAYLPAKGWAWSGGTPQQMAVYNHLQLLCYHSKPNNIISGDIVYADFVNMEAIYEWGGANHLLVSGSYNFLNGRIESAVLREFKFYTEMWSDVSGAETPTTEEDNRTTAESGGTSKSSTYTNKTDVYLGDGGGGGGSSTLAGLNDVAIEDLQNGQTLVFDAVDGVWKNKAGGAGGSAALETDIVAGVGVGFISKSATLSVGMTFTEFVQMMFSQGVKTVPPSVSLAGVPSQAIEVGTEVTLNVTSSFKDGYFANTDEVTTAAGCQPGAASFELNGLPVTMPHTFVASSAAVNTISVSQPHEASTIKPTKGGAELSETIPAGTARSESTFVVGYRAFWGYMTDDEAESIDSAAIRGLEHTDTIINPTQNVITLLNTKYEIPGGQDIIIAVPEGYALGEVKDEDGDFAKAFKALDDVVVKCAGTATKNYKVYRFDNGTPYPMEILSITIKKA